MSRWLAALVLLGPNAQLQAADPPGAGRRLTDAPNPLSIRVPSADELARLRTGREVFGTHWVVAGTPGASGHSGVGPLFNAASCDSCHEGGGHGQGPIEDGTAPVALVIKLESQSARREVPPSGDPVYGRVFNTAAVPGAPVEGVVTVRYREIGGNYYPGGGYWHIRDPQYRLLHLHYGQLAPSTVIQPRVAPALYGVGLLEAVPGAAIIDDASDAPTESGISGEPALQSRHGAQAVGRFGWQGSSISVRDQTMKAFAREMGVTSSGEPSDDCTPAQTTCLSLPNGGSPEVADEPLDALVAYVNSIAVPYPPLHPIDGDTGARIFARLGCGACHRPRLPIEVLEAGGTHSASFIAPYSDLRLHDLGPRMADRTVSGKPVPTKWRTAPLWGLGHRIATEQHPTFLHDGRARTIEEAILWHFGEGARSLNRFKGLLPAQRDALLGWLQTL